MSGLNQFQAQHVESTFAHVDRLLGTVEALSRPNTSPFARERSDVSPEEARFITAFVQQMRMRMIAALDRLGLPRPVPRVSARHSADVTLRFAEIALADLSTSSLRGYGTVDPEAGAEVTALAADVCELIERGRALFHEEENGGLAARIAALPGPFGEALRALERFSADHALADVRPLIAEAAERVAGETFDVGVFGRVSAGKSSLINALIGTDVLPVGATPVTAVPLRLHHGELGAIVNFEDGTARAIAVSEIADYATEERNPGNRARVRALEIAAPTVPSGLRFLDTPGIGSLSASAPAQAFAWLPRCDLGLVLMAAGTAVGTDDLALVSGFVHAGIDCRVLISKSDLLKGDEIARTISYVQRELAAVLGDARAIPVHTVSADLAAVSSLIAFRATVLEPLAAGHAAALHDALRARLHRLVAITRRALAESVDTAEVPAQGEAANDTRDTTRDVMLRRRVRGEAAHVATRARTDALADDTTRVLEAAAGAVAGVWSEHGDGTAAAAAARATIIRVTGAALDDVRKAIDDIHESGVPSATTDALAGKRLPPVFDAAFLDKLPDLSPPRFLSAPRRVVAERRLAQIRPALETDLARYAARLYAWGEQALKQAEDAGADKSHVPQDAIGSTNTTDSTDPEADALARIDSLIDTPIQASEAARVRL